MAQQLHHELAVTAEASMNEIVIVSGAGFLGALIAEAIATLRRCCRRPQRRSPCSSRWCRRRWSGPGVWAINPIVSASILLGVLHPLVPEPALVWLALAAIVGSGHCRRLLALHRQRAHRHPHPGAGGRADGPLGQPDADLVWRWLTVGLTCAAATFVSVRRIGKP
ncbi:MAG: hypothetical protein U5L04_04735 [Trueperaceae bacterium]|nr:hypothetical protein [Trueperaceae bacterium]